MTLSLGDIVRKVKRDDNDNFVENEVHIIYEVVALGTMQEKDAEGNYVSTSVTKLKVVR